MRYVESIKEKAAKTKQAEKKRNITYRIKIRDLVVRASNALEAIDLCQQRFKRGRFSVYSVQPYWKKK